MRRNLGALDTAVGHYDKGHGRSTLYVATSVGLGLFIFCREADGYAFNHSLHLYVKEAVHQDDEGG